METGRKLVASGQQGQLEPQKVRVLRELESKGYVIEPPSAGSQDVVICRHPVSPAIAVGDDGRVELLDVRPKPQGLTTAQVPPRQIHWGRGLLVLGLVGLATFLGLIVVAMIVG